MALRDKLDETKLRSLTYGDNTPYVTVNIDNQKVTSLRSNLPNSVRNDGTILNSSLIDTARIGTFLIEKPWFSAKQIGLQLMNVKPNFGYRDGSILKTPSSLQLYLPTNTLAQVAAQGIGGHLERWGLLPGVGNSYEDLKISEKNLNNKGPLVNFFNDKIKSSELNQPISSPGSLLNTLFSNIKSSIENYGTGKFASNISNLFPNPTDNLYSYISGPKSMAGVGSTTIRRFYNSLNEISTKDNLNGFYILPSPQISEDSRFGDINNKLYISRILFKGASVEANKMYGQPNVFFKDENIRENPSYLSQMASSVIPGSNAGQLFYMMADSTVTNGINNSNVTPLYDKTIPESGIIYGNYYGESVQIKKFSWNTVRRELRVGSGRKDAINLTPLFTSKGGDNNFVRINSIPYSIRDLVKFRIEAINTDDTSESTWMVFRSYITNVQDQSTPAWTDVKYNGRGEKFYIYNGFERTISFNFQVAALSKEEMRPMYEKLNYLMSNTMPDYNDNIMRGPFTKLTIGNWIDRQPGIITELSYRVNENSSWEIALDEPEGGMKLLILPHVIDVTLSFKPIGANTQGKNKTFAKGNENSNIAQNYNGDINYITGSIMSGEFRDKETFAVGLDGNLDPDIPSIDNINQQRLQPVSTTGPEPSGQLKKYLDNQQQQESLSLANAQNEAAEIGNQIAAQNIGNPFITQGFNINAMSTNNVGSKGKGNKSYNTALVAAKKAGKKKFVWNGKTYPVK